ncbi:LON peptidase substrate-binding domain-containing protein [Thermomonas sp.]|jgi:Lon protease-like protein|uniref:LON peptidase substrate-binding domain-containing protein n=1 Tax=Thermomonas sp. TaxID=1971895 RepID=UPI001B5D5954|nr:LON peptidase substrate-binding domain-containing protein [Thermomonas sp.]MBK6333921.1 LON peptidase substrate-binding domain-containing protein [Thermomonas sp.]MBK6416592.1 LON peptidase substrate-binding domain-containing protein [Thermomonas sp.]MBK6923813.1 LON peptidase substrate-binding domain-containing protein [Thermomonas sp.]MBK7205474.1 LON peptidase substrate-binding domain-containing protein [Thermomonas sp.]MBK9669417.1 LON peptidase substrate-binding domain-containing prote
MPEAGAPLPLLPLQAVLVPGAGLDLRIFERRYLDMVRDCGRSGSGFGVCLILEGSETGAAATPAAFGTEALIEDFGSTPDGLLSLRVRGRRRFHVLRTRVRDNGLLVADVEWREDAAGSPRLRPEHALLAELLRRILLQVAGEHAEPAPLLFESAAWVGWRLAELLPLEMRQRQALLQDDDPHARLQRLLEAIAAEG